MAKFTSLQFMEAIGLKISDYNGAKILLRSLLKKGVAKEVGKISRHGTGRPMIVYELPKKISLDLKPPKRHRSWSGMKSVKANCTPKKCQCVTTDEILKRINEKRKEEGMEKMPYHAFIGHYRTMKRFVPPSGKIGSSYVFEGQAAKKIVSLLWKKQYRSIPRVDWFAWRKKIA